jgi:DNA-binding LacI/PurR family transcriptional regulator
MGKKLKNKDLAARLGVSGTLVSLVLNNKADQHGIKKETQEKVLALARQMGYFEVLREKGEEAPIEQKPGIIGMIVPTIHDPFVYEIAPHLEKAFSNIGLGFSILTKDPDDMRFTRLNTALRKFFSGLILVSEAADDYTIRSLKAGNFPFVLLEKYCKTMRLNTVCTDSSAGAALVARHIEKLGYKNAVIITTGNSSYDKQATVTLIDALERIETLNKPVVVELSQYPGMKEPDISQIERFMRPPYRAEILITINSGLVYPVMALLRKNKLRIPQDVALISMEEGIGFDLMLSPVTCLRKPLSTLAVKTANIAWSEVKNAGKGKYKRQVNVAPELVVRNSCGTI